MNQLHAEAVSGLVRDQQPAPALGARRPAPAPNRPNPRRPTPRPHLLHLLHKSLKLFATLQRAQACRAGGQAQWVGCSARPGEW